LEQLNSFRVSAVPGAIGFVVLCHRSWTAEVSCGASHARFKDHSAYSPG
jgi:hypothetical protein